MSSPAPEHASTNPSRRQDPRVPSIQERCPHCARMQELNLQFATIADAKSKELAAKIQEAEAYRQEAETYKRLYEAALLNPDLARAA